MDNRHVICWKLKIETNILCCIFQSSIAKCCSNRKYIFQYCFTNKEEKSTTSSTSAKGMSHKALGQIASVNKPQEIGHSSDVVSIKKDFCHSKNAYNSLRNMMGKLNGISSTRLLLIYSLKN